MRCSPGQDGLKAGLGQTRDFGAILAKPLCRKTSGHKAELPHPGQSKRPDLHRCERGTGRIEKTSERAERTGAPSANLKPLQPQPKTPELYVDHSVVYAERVANLAAGMGHCAVLAQRFLECVQGLANPIDQGIGAAEVETVSAAAVTITEAVVWAKGSCAAAAPGGVDGPIHAEELWPGGQEDEGRMGELVHAGRVFRFAHGWDLPVTG
jgi:hypothetical protein